MDTKVSVLKSCNPQLVRPWTYATTVVKCMVGSG